MTANVKYYAVRGRNYNSLTKFVNKKAATLLFATFWVSYLGIWSTVSEKTGK